MKQIGIFIFLFFIQVYCHAQEEPGAKTMGAGIEYYYAVNGHGAFISPHISLAKGKHQFKLGPCIQKRSMQVKGAKLTYSYMLAGMDAEEQLDVDFKDNVNGSWRVNLFTYGQFVDYTSLSYKRAKEETLLNEGAATDWNRVYLSTAEAGLGAEIDAKIFKYLQFRAYVGISVYSHLNYPDNMYQDKTAAAFITGIGINVPSFKKSEKKN